LTHSKYNLKEEERWQVYDNGTLVVFKLDRLPGCSENPYIPVVQLFKPIDNETCRYILHEHVGLYISFPYMNPKLRTKWDEWWIAAIEGSKKPASDSPDFSYLEELQETE